MNDRIAELERQLAEARREAGEKETLPIKIGNKQNVVVGSGGALGQRFPVTLYAPSWLILLREDNVAAIKAFIEEHKNELSWGK